MLQGQDLGLSVEVFPVHFLSAFDLDLSVVGLHLPLKVFSLLLDLGL